MKNLFFALLGILIFASCTKDDDEPEIKVTPNISVPDLDNKSGGVYFASTYAGEYIFRLNLKNGDDLLVCEMFHDEKYSKLSAPKTDWQVGEALESFEFSQDDIKLTISLNPDGQPEAQIKVGETDYEAVIFKSTTKQPVKVYSGLEVEEVFDVGELHIRRDAFVMIIIEEKYFTGMKMEGDSYWPYRYTPELTAFVSISATDLIFLQPDILEYIEEWGWERKVSYNEDRIHSYEYEDLENGNSYELELTLHRRFKE